MRDCSSSARSMLRMVLSRSATEACSSGDAFVAFLDGGARRTGRSRWSAVLRGLRQGILRLRQVAAGIVQARQLVLGGDGQLTEGCVHRRSAAGGGLKVFSWSSAMATKAGLSSLCSTVAAIWRMAVSRLLRAALQFLALGEQPDAEPQSAALAKAIIRQYDFLANFA